MKAIVHERYGPPAAVLELRDVDPPVVQEDEVLVRVHAAGVNWADWAITSGVPYVIRPLYGLRRPRHGVRGTDVAGTVEAVGSNVVRLHPGDEVLGVCTGAFAEYVSTSPDNLVGKPTTLTFEQAAGVPEAGLVALQALRDIDGVQPGQRVLVNGASGGIGSFAVQIARSFGAHVTGVCSTGNVDLVRSIGADHVIDYTTQDFTRQGQRYDVILDIADTHSLSARRRALTPHGTLIPNSGAGGRWIGSAGRIAKARLLSPFVPQTLRPFVVSANNNDLMVLTGLIDSGDVTPVIDGTYPFSATAEAIARMGLGHARGKIVVTV